MMPGNERRREAVERGAPRGGEPGLEGRTGVRVPATAARPGTQSMKRRERREEEQQGERG